MQTKTSKFRQTGWKVPGTSMIEIFYGTEAPDAALGLVKIWDILVTTTSIVEPHPDGGMMIVDESHSA